MSQCWLSWSHVVFEKFVIAIHCAVNDKLVCQHSKLMHFYSDSRESLHHVQREVEIIC